MRSGSWGGPAGLVRGRRGACDAVQGGLESLGHTVGRPSFARLANEPEAADVAPVVPSLLGRLDVRA